MAVESFELITVEADFITADIVVWRRYRTRADGILELMLDYNPHLAKLHRVSPFLPVGTQIRIPIDRLVLANSPKPKTVVQIWGTV